MNPTNNDYRLARILAEIARKHYVELRASGTTNEYLSDKIAKAILDFRNENG